MTEFSPYLNVHGGYLVGALTGNRFFARTAIHDRS
jgi:hypothetical protein